MVLSNRRITKGLIRMRGCAKTGFLATGPKYLTLLACADSVESISDDFLVYEGRDQNNTKGRPRSARKRNAISMVAQH